jgi:hypothetical protein
MVGSINKWTSWSGYWLLAFQVWLYCGNGCPCFSGSTRHFEENVSRSLSNAAYKHWVTCSVGHTFKRYDRHSNNRLSLYILHEPAPQSMALCCNLLVSFDGWKLKTNRSPCPRNISRLKQWVSSSGSQWRHACRHSDLRSNYVLKGPAEVVFCPSHNWVYLVSVGCVCVYNFICTERSPVEMQTPTYCNLIGRRWLPRILCYRPAVFCQLRLMLIHFRKEKFETRLKTVVISISLLLF